MFIDGRRVDDGSVIETDLAIIGAGAAGITIARELKDSGISIALIESGGFDLEPETQDLYAGPTTGIPYSLNGQRLRYFGGTTNHWGGQTHPMEPLDFEVRDWVPHSGWPIARADLDPYYHRASEVCETNPYRYENAEAWSEGGKHQPLPLPGGDVTTRWFVFSRHPSKFAEKYRGDIERAPSVQCFHHSNVLEIIVNENVTRVERISLATLTGGRFQVRPRVSILAAGGIENARILLLSNSVAKAGIGNDRDLVGRYFAEHPSISLPCEVLLTDPSLRAPYYSYPTHIQGQTIWGMLMLTERYLRRHRSIGTVLLFTAGSDIESGAPPGAGHEDASRSLEPALASLLRSTTSSAAGPGPGVRFSTACMAEQVPNPDSRVFLSTEKDGLGLRRSVLDWRLSEFDRDRIHKNLLSFARLFGQWGEGQVRVLFPDNYDWANAQGGGHHMGTTRMASDPGKGVVDADCRLHGLSNLYIAGSSVFTTYATVNPTLTIVALALRLADHLRSSFRRGDLQ